MSEISASSSFVNEAPSLVGEHVDAFTELPGWQPIFAVDTPWQQHFNEQLTMVLRGWLDSKSFSRRGRRDYEKLKVSVRTADAMAEPLSLR